MSNYQAPQVGSNVSVVYQDQEYFVIANQDGPDATGVNAYFFKHSGKVVGIPMSCEAQMMHDGQQCIKEHIRDLEEMGIF